jgi:hypothetical protein
MNYFKVKKAIVFHLFMMLSFAFYVHAQDASNSADQALSNLKGMWDGASKFVTGMAQSFGYVPSNYVYSFRVWNDSPGDVVAASQEVTKVLGAGFSGRVSDYLRLLPFTNSHEHFSAKKLYFIVWILGDKDTINYGQYETKIKDYAIKGAEYSLGPLGAGLGAFIGSIETTEALEKWKLYSKTISQPDEKNIYYYRAYTHKGQIQGEYLGIKTTTQEFTGVFYNSSNTDVSVKFMKDAITYQAMLESETFSLLNSTTDNPFSIRPEKNEQRAFTFYQGNTVLAAIPISAEGICNMQEDPATQKMVAGAPMVYTYEVSNGQSGPEVSMQGLAVGHYDQPFDQADLTKEVVRDINPMRCHFWYQSAEQAQASEKQADTTQVPFTMTEDVWIFYKTKDFTYQKKVDAGAVIDFALLRPRISEKDSWLYIAALKTTDDKKALSFLNRLADGVIGQDLKEPVSSISQFNENTVLTTMQSNSHGKIDDTKGSGIQGYVLLADKILPRGVGIGPFYYQIKPTMVHLGQLTELISSYLNPKLFTTVSDMNQEVTHKVEQWIKLYPQNNQTVISQVTDYLQQKGVDQIITVASSARTLNAQGNKAVQTLVSGPVSIAHYPHQQQAGTNKYVYYLGATPTDWPASK